MFFTEVWQAAVFLLPPLSSFLSYTKRAFHFANLLLISCFIKVTLDYYAYSWSTLNMFWSVLVLEATKRWAQIVCEWQNREFCWGILAALGTYLGDGGHPQQDERSHKSAMRICYIIWLCCHSEGLQWAGTSWSSIPGNAEPCAWGEQPQEPVHTAAGGQRLDGRQLGREAPRILLDKKPAVCSCGQGRQQHPRLHKEYCQ